MRCRSSIASGGHHYAVDGARCSRRRATTPSSGCTTANGSQARAHWNACLHACMLVRTSAHSCLQAYVHSHVFETRTHACMHTHGFAVTLACRCTLTCMHTHMQARMLVHACSQACTLGSARAHAFTLQACAHTRTTCTHMPRTGSRVRARAHTFRQSDEEPIGGHCAPQRPKNSLGAGNSVEFAAEVLWPVSRQNSFQPTPSIHSRGRPRKLCRPPPSLAVFVKKKANGRGRNGGVGVVHPAVNSCGPIKLWPYIAMAYIVMAYIVMTPYSHGLYSYGPI